MASSTAATRYGVVMLCTGFVVAMTLCVIHICNDGDEQPGPLRGWPVSHLKLQPAKIVVQSGTTFLCNDVRCQLLGVKESADPKIREQAAEFSKKWFEGPGSHIHFSNDSNPLETADGVAVVWVVAHVYNSARLNEDLLRMGLVDLDEENWPGYRFLVVGMAEDYYLDWRERLREAKEANKRGEKPELHFERRLK